MSLTLIDARTALLLVALLYLLLPLSAWYALARQQSQVVTLWCSGGLLAAAGLALISARDAIPAILSYHAGNTLLVACLLLWCQAFRLDMNKPWPVRYLVLATLAFLLVYTALNQWTTPIVRGTFSKIVFFVLVSHVTWLASCIARAERNLNAYALASAYGLLSLSFAVQIIIAIINPSQEPSPFKDSADTVMVALSAMITAVVGYFSYVGMMLDRSVRQQVAALAEQAWLAESLRLTEQIVALDRDRSMSLMAAGLGHELNQPLTAALTNTQVAQMSLRAGRHDRDTLYGLLDRVAFNTDRAAQILERTRDMGTGAAFEPTRLDLVGLARRNLVALLDQKGGPSFDVRDTLGNSPCWVIGDEVQLSQVLSNVYRNAFEAMSQSDTPTLALSLATHDCTACLRIRDNGIGLAGTPVADRTPAFVSRKADGLGIGLSISRAILARHDGSLKLRDNNGTGTLVEIALPLAHSGHAP